MTKIAISDTFRNSLIILILGVASFAALRSLYNNFQEQFLADRQEYLSQNLQKATIEFREELDKFQLLVAGIRSFNLLNDGTINAVQAHNYIRELLHFSDYENDVIVNLLDTSHTFLFSVSNTDPSPNDLIGVQLSTLRDTSVLRRLEMIMMKDVLIALPPFNMYEGFVGLPINFSVKENNRAIGYIATVIDLKNFIDPLIKMDVENEFTFKFKFGNSTEFDREEVYNGREVYHSRKDSLNLHLPDEAYVYADIEAFLSVFNIGMAYKNNDSNNSFIPFLQRTAAIIGALIVLLFLMAYQFLQQLSNTKLIRDAKNTAEEMNNVLKKFISAVSYDLKVPLDIVQKHLGFLKENNTETLDDESRDRLSIVSRNTTFMSELMDDFLSYAEIIKSKENQGPVDLYLLLNEIQKYYNQDEVDIYSEPLPKVIGDKAQLNNLFRQLISNGLKFNQHARPKIIISSEYIPGRVVIRVSDDGIGIKSEYLEKVFDDFARIEEDHYSGTGLGLAICKEIIKNHGGNISAENNDLGGTDIVFDLKRAENELILKST